MSSSPHTDISQVIPSDLAALEVCSEESVYAPGYIQPHGMLLLLQEAGLKILQVSENAEQFLGVTAETLLNKPLQQLFEPAQVQQITRHLAQEDTLKPGDLFQLTTQEQTVQTFRAAMHRLGDGLILELEPQPIPESDPSPSFYHRLQDAIAHLRSVPTLMDLVQTLAREIKVLTGFDRVMVYRFEADEHGVVIAEEKETHLESYLGLHYPATDIPVPARKLFLRNWMRYIPDINYTPVQLIPTHHPLTNNPLDLSDGVLRGVSPYHIEYLQNMGVAGSMTISLLDDKHLWGLIACHHYSHPRLVDYETRKTCELLGQVASLELTVRQQEMELQGYRMQVKSIQEELQQTLLQEPDFVEQVLTRNSAQFLGLVHAQGAAILLENHLTLVGKTPDREEVEKLVASLELHTRGPVFATDKLPRLYPEAKQFKDKASGLLAISILLSHATPKSYHILWFRPEQIQMVNWAGKPQDTIALNNLGEMELCPRKSFELWKETVEETSLPWEAAELEAADEMRNALMLAVLEFSQISLEQAAERAAIANRAKSQFLAKMSHELRTPLNAILGFTQVMARSNTLSSEFQEHLGIISRSGEHLLTLINDVLEMSRIEAGQLVLNKNCFDFLQFISSIQGMFSLKASNKGLLLKIEQMANVPRFIVGDEAKLRQILLNLLSNAIKFTSEGSVTLRIESLPQSLPFASSQEKTSSPTKGVQASMAHSTEVARSQINLRFAVQDTGSGIASTDLESIFEAFMQTDRGRDAQGTGLGLSISRQFARLMGGDITVQSTLNQGSTFTCDVVLSIPESIDVVESPTQDQVIGLEPDQPTYRILVAENVLENQQLLMMLLQPVGFDVRVAANGAEAIAQWRDWHPHLILMDIEMPVMNGYEAVQHIRAQESLLLVNESEIENPTQVTKETQKKVSQKKETQKRCAKQEGTQKSTKIIALTAYAFETDRIASLQAGCDDYISKPFKETLLFDKIAHHLGVEYCYGEASPSSQEMITVTQQPLSSQALKTMPANWVAQVHEAALDLDDVKLYELIAEIPKDERSLIETIKILIDNFEFEAIAMLTQP